MNNQFSTRNEGRFLVSTKTRSEKLPHETVFVFSGGEPAMSLPPSMSFGKLFAHDDGSVTTFPPDGAIFPYTGKNELPDGWHAGELPFRTFVMLIALVTQLLVTELTHYLFVTSRKLSLRYDFFQCYKEG